MADELLEKIDQIRRRIPVSYEEARAALHKASGNLVEALILLEKEKKNNVGKLFIGKIQKLWETGSRRRVRVRKGDRVLMEVPATAGVLGVVFAPYLTLMGTVIALASRCRIEVGKNEHQPAGTD